MSDPMDWSPLGSFVHEIFQARKWVVYLSPGDLPDSGIKPLSLALAGEFFTAEPPEKPALVVEEPFCWSTLFSVRIAPCVAVFLMCSSEELSSVSS